MKKYRLEMLVAFIIFNIGLDLYYDQIVYPVYFYLILLATMLYLAKVIIVAKRNIKRNTTAPVQPMESHTVGNDFWAIWIDRSGQRLLQLGYKDKEGKELFYSTLLTMKRYKALKRGYMDCRTCFKDPCKGVVAFMVDGKQIWLKPREMAREITPGVNPFIDRKFHRKERDKIKSIWKKFFPWFYKSEQEKS